MPMPAERSRFSPLMCLTRDGTGIPHAAQAETLCEAGASWVQLRMKNASLGAWLAQAGAAAEACHRHGSLLIVNDSVRVAVESGADGAHLGSGDGDWREARALLGPERILGGTVNSLEDAVRAAEAGCLDYVGVGPLRFTATKVRLAPLLGLGGIRAVTAALKGIPAWAIGGVRPGDMPSLREAGLAGAAVSSALFEGADPAAAIRRFLLLWEGRTEEAALA